MAEGVSAGAQDFGVAAKTRSSEIAPAPSATTE